MTEINNTVLLSQVRAMAEKARVETTDFIEGKEVGESFSTTLEKAINQVNEMQGHAADLKTRYSRGDESVSLSDAMIAAQRSSLAFDAALEVRNKLVQAYQDIMNMPI